jgi:acyl-CoA reductase-like NAD-dependent aldehyde dehydrogenase
MASELRLNLINGVWTNGDAQLDVQDPYTGAVLGAATLAAPRHIEAAVAAAAAAFETYRSAPSHVRASLLARVRARVEAEREEFAQLIRAEAGKPIKFARGEVARSLQTLRLAAEEAKRGGGEYIPLDLEPASEGYLGFTRRVPRGPVTALWPFNFPLNLLVHKIGPALACGCPVIMRPPSATPLTGHRLAEILHEEASALGLPPGVAQFVSCDHHTAAPLIADRRIKAVSFTGSDTVGWDIKRRANKKQVMLELGGQASLIVEPDAPDLKFAAQRAALGAFAYAGQVCISVQRIMVNSAVYDEFLPLLLAETKKLKTGDPADEKVTVGPLISTAAADRIGTWLAQATQLGAQVLCGRRSRPNLMTPHLLTDVPDTTELYCGEVFGPVAVIERYQKLEDAIALTNASRFGLQSAVFTANINKALAAWRDVEVGGLVINDYPTFRVDHMPYGGVKDSGFGREGVRYAIEEYTEPRLMVVRGG